MDNPIKFPSFWTAVEECLHFKSEDILNIKELLTALGYTTIQSVSKLCQRNEIQLLKGEFDILKSTNQAFIDKFETLNNLNFGSGFILTLADISKKIKTRFATVDRQALRAQIVSEISKSCPEINASQVLVRDEGGDTKCSVVCGKCNGKFLLSSYVRVKTSSKRFRVSNFVDHYKSCFGSKDKRFELLKHVFDKNLRSVQRQLVCEKNRNRSLAKRNANLQTQLMQLKTRRSKAILKLWRKQKSRINGN